VLIVNGPAEDHLMDSLNCTALLLLDMYSLVMIFSLSCLPEAVPDHGCDCLLRVNDVMTSQQCNL